MRHSLLVLLFVASASTVSLAQTPSIGNQAKLSISPVQQELMALMQTEYTAGLRNDVGTIDRIWGDEYISTGPKGQAASKAQMLKYYKTAPVSQAKITPLQLQDLQVHVYAEVAVMTGVATGTSAAGKPVGNSVRFTRVHVKRQGQWVVVASHLSRVESLTQAKNN